MRRFFMEQSKINAPAPIITGSDAEHVKKVLRLKPGDTIGLFDGKGLEYEAIILALRPKGVEVSISGRFPSRAESSVQIIVAQAFLKEKKMDGLVRQLTELGIIKFIPFFAERSVSRPDENRLLTRKERWEKITKEALKQCGRGRIMEIGTTVSFHEVLKFGQDCDLKIIFWENELNPINLIYSPSASPLNRIFVIVGPEGGFTTREIKNARARGFFTAALGPRILRAETATIAACTLLQFLFGDMGQKNLDNDQRF